MWWQELSRNAEELEGMLSSIHPTAEIAKDATLTGEVIVGAGTKIFAGAVIHGPVKIGAGCIIGNNAMIRGPVLIENDVLIGFTAEIKNAVIRKGTKIGHVCYVADSVLEEGVTLGGVVRTSNYRLDGGTISAYSGDTLIDTGLTKLGAYIGAHAALGSMCYILPGRIVAPGSFFGPRITIEKNLPAARYRLKQELDVTPLET